MHADTGRIQREAEFHDNAAEALDLDSVLVDETFTSVTASENQHILAQFGDLRGRTVLDFGCGMAEGGIYLAKLGARVVAVDVSSGMLRAAERLAARHGVSIDTRLAERPAIPAEDAEFDCIYGNGVLHHVDLSWAGPELARVLKPHGTGCFIEPLPYNPLINVYRRIASEVRTVDERPLSFSDIRALSRCFDEVSHREFWLTSLGVFLKFYLIDRVHPNQERYWKKIYTDAARLEPWYRPLRTLDEQLLRWLPLLGGLCWTTVITVRRPRR
jgi:SAM-dependent methyltransferase